MLFHDDLDAYIAAQEAKLRALRTAALPPRCVVRGVYGRGRAPESSRTEAVASLTVDALGVAGDPRHGSFRDSGGRERNLYPRGTRIRQHRHLCIVSQLDCQILSDRLGVDITPQLLGANLLLDGLDGADLSLSILPQSTHLVLTCADDDVPTKPPVAVLVHQLNQRGCGITGKVIADHYGDPSLVKAFREQSVHHRGILCSVEYPVAPEAQLTAGMHIVLQFPVGEAP